MKKWILVLSAFLIFSFSVIAIYITPQYSILFGNKVSSPTYIEDGLALMSSWKEFEKIFVNKTEDINSAKILIISTKTTIPRKTIIASLESNKIVVMIGNSSEYYFGKLLLGNYATNSSDIPFGFSVMLNKTDDSFITIAYIKDNALVTTSLTCNNLSINCTNYYAQKLIQKLRQILQELQTKK